MAQPMIYDRRTDSVNVGALLEGSNRMTKSGTRGQSRQEKCDIFLQL